MQKEQMAQFYRDVIGIEDISIIQEMVQNSICRHLNKKEYLVRAGEKEKNVFFLVSGVLRGVLRVLPNKEVTDCFEYQKGAILLSNANLDVNGVADLDIQALVNCDVIGVPMSLALRLIQQHPKLQFFYFTQVQRSLNKHVKIERIRCMYSEDRIRWFMETYPDLIQILEAQYVASYLNMDKATYSRICKEINKQQSQS